MTAWSPAQGASTVLASSLSSFAVGVDFVGHDVVVAVRGEVDILTAPELGAIVDAVLDLGHQSVVLDLAELDFMDASGLRVIARAARVLRPSGSVMTVRSPSAMVRRLLDLVGLAEVVRLEPPEAEGAGLRRSERSVVSSEIPAAVDSDLSVRTLKSMMSFPADRDVVDGALRLVVALARATVGGADGASVSLRRHGRLATTAASDQTVSDMDADQYDTGEGPCVDASVEGRWFHASSVATETRWPAFTPRARALGINAILSSPLLTRDGPVGALNIYSRTAAAFTPADQSLASVFAAEASAILANAALGDTDGQLDGHLAVALRSRQMVALAQGMIMQRDHVSADAAYAVLQRSSRGTGMPLKDRAAQIVASAQVLELDHGPVPQGGHHG